MSKRRKRARQTFQGYHEMYSRGLARETGPLPVTSTAGKFMGEPRWRTPRASRNFHELLTRIENARSMEELIDLLEPELQQQILFHNAVQRKMGIFIPQRQARRLERDASKYGKECHREDLRAHGLRMED